jgi:foldase protein PrsA
MRGRPPPERTRLHKLATISDLLMRHVKSTMALGAVFVLSVAVAGCGSGIPGNAVANVAGNPITLGAVNHWMYVAAKSQAAQSPGNPVIVPTDPPNFTGCIATVRAQIPALAKTSAATLRKDCNQLFGSLSSQVMDFLIKAYWYQADAVRQHVNVTDAQVQSAFNTAKQAQFPTAAQFQTFLSQTGQTLPDILYRFRVSQIYTKLLAKHGSAVTQAQIQAYYSSHLSQFGTPETRNIRIVLTKTQAQALAAKAALSHGKSWDAVAKQYSSDPTSKARGGLLTGVTKGQQDAALDKASFSAPVGKVLGPVQGQFGFYIFEVALIKPATQQSLAQATALIRQTLASTQRTSAQTAVDSRAKKDWLSQTKCRSPYAMADCSGYKAPKTSTTGATTTG